MISFDIEEIVATIRNRGYRMDHDIHYWSSFMGSPLLLYGNWIAYTEGTDFNICNYGFDGRSMSNSQISKVIDYAANRIGARYVDLWSDSSVSPSSPVGWHASAFFVDSFNVPVQFDLQNRRTSFLRMREVRSAFRLGYKVVEYSQKPMDYRAIDLIRAYCEKKEFSPFDASFIGNISVLSESPNAFCFNVMKGDELIGFGTVSKYLKKTWVFHHLFIADGEKGVGDLAYHHVYSRALASGVNYLDLGYSINENLLRYKKSIGADRIFPQTFFFKSVASNFSLDPWDEFHWRARKVLGITKR